MEVLTKCEGVCVRRRQVQLLEAEAHGRILDWVGEQRCASSQSLVDPEETKGNTRARSPTWFWSGSVQQSTSHQHHMQPVQVQSVFSDVSTFCAIKSEVK